MPAQEGPNIKPMCGSAPATTAFFGEEHHLPRRKSAFPLGRLFPCFFLDRAFSSCEPIFPFPLMSSSQGSRRGGLFFDLEA